MELAPFFKSVIDQDRAAVVLCDREDRIIYMNPAAADNYAKHGGAALVGQSIMDCHNPASRETIARVRDWFAANPTHNLVHTFYNEKQNKDVYMVALRDEAGNLIGYYEKHEFRTKDDMEFYCMEEQ